ncbi:MAG: hypothetical protein C0404_01245 [Verrucomicrobia bacterium]|nr:hypothetical protein [Verrucomicrobiota bacterium]
MKTRSTSFWLVPCVIAVMAGLSVCLAETASPQVETTPARTYGVVLYPDGVTPVSDLPIRVWSVERRKMVYRTTTAVDGSFSLPELSAGRCQVFVGRLKIDMQVFRPTAESLWQRNDMVIVLPRSMILMPSVGGKIYDVMLAPLILRPPESPKVVSP